MRGNQLLPLAVVALSLLALGCGSDSEDESKAEVCRAPEPPPEATRKVGTADGTTVLPGGRTLSPVGVHAVVGGFPVDVRTHPMLPFAYVANTGYAKRALQVVSLSDGTLIQELPRQEAFFGLAIAPDGKRLYASGGQSGLLEVYDVAADGKLTAAAQVDVGGYPAGVVLSKDGSRLWVGRFVDQQVAQIDVATLQIATSIPMPERAYALLEVPQRNELYVAAFGARLLSIVDLAQGTVAKTLEVGGNPVGLAANADGSRVFVSVSDGDIVVSIDTATRELAGSTAVSEPGLLDPAGNPLPGSSPTGLAFDAAAGKLYVARAADNAVSIFDASLQPLGAMPVGWYPTSIALSDAGKKLIVTNGKGVGAGPLLDAEESGKASMEGSISLIDLASLDLAATTAQVEQNVRKPSQVYPFDCEGTFPVPTQAGRPTPIEHIVLVVRENKTYDTLLGALEGADGDPSLVLFGEDVTPNISALARRFTNHDNFYNDSECSVQGHLWLTSSFVNDYMERIWIEDYRGNGSFETDSPTERGQPDFGTFFTHLMKHGKSFINYGEVVGTFGEYEGDSVMSHTDLKYPGMFFSLNIKDEDKVRYAITRLIDEENFPQFVFMLLPRDHTYGTKPDEPTPESMINDNDYATGLFVDAVSHSKFWDSTAIFILEDDPQIGADHVDYHRSILVVASPWAKRGHNSRVHTSFPSLFRTFELMLGIPPMNRYDALATPLFDAFTMEKDSEPYDAIARSVPDATNPQNLPGSDWSEVMDFSGPDRNPFLGDVLWWYRKGSLPERSKLAREIARGAAPHRAELDDDGDDEVERDVYDRSLAHAERWIAEHGSKPR